MSDNRFVVFYYDGSEDTKLLATEVVNQERLWRVLTDAKAESAKISVYELGECVLDWS